MARTEAHDPTKELGYLAKRSGLYMAGKSTAEAVGETLAESSGGQMLGLSALLGGTAAGIVTVALAATVSATLTQMDFVHRKDNIVGMYKEEFASRLRKPLNKVVRDDFDILAKENAVLGEELHQIKKQRTFGVAMSFIASMAALSVVMLALPAVAGAIATAATGSVVTGEAAMHALGWFGATAAKAITGLITYNTIKNPLHHIADKFFDLDYKTTHDHIVKLSRDREAGRAITREQIMEVFATAHPTLDHMIKREYGKNFEDLSPDKKSVVTMEMAKIIPLDKLATDINSGKVNVTELAFAVEGQTSGIQHGRPVEEKKGIVKAIFSGMKRAFIRTEIERDGTHERITAIVASTPVYGNGKNVAQDGTNHVQRIGKRIDSDLAHVERHEQRALESQLNQQRLNP